MATQFSITITKSIIKRCKNCGNELHEAEKNCAIAIALIDIFPEVHVTADHIFPWGIDLEKENNARIPLPVIAQQFIKLFDGFSLTPRLRLLLPEFEFTIDVPDEVIERINIDEVKELIGDNKKTIRQQPANTFSVIH
jgi:hypothetical protein